MERSELQPIKLLPQETIGTLYLQASRNNVGWFPTFAELGLESSGRDESCLRGIVRNCYGCGVHELLESRMKRFSGQIPREQILIDFSREWCPENMKPPIPATQTKPYLVTKIY